MIPLPPEYATVREAVKAWERLRLIYNGALLLPGLFVAWRVVALEFPGGPFPYSFLDLVVQCGLFAVMANLLYCLGPYVEFVITAIGYPVTAKRARYILFGVGLFGSIGLIALAAIMLELWVALPSQP